LLSKLCFSIRAKLMIANLPCLEKNIAQRPIRLFFRNGSWPGSDDTQSTLS
jgi:hypothetical protein